MAFIDRYTTRPKDGGSFFNYYLGMPDIDKSGVYTPPVEETDPTLTSTVTSAMPTDQTGGGDGVSVAEQATVSGVSGIEEVDFNDIKYDSLDAYLGTTDFKLDRSGMFSRINIPEDEETKAIGKTSTTGGLLLGNLGLLSFGTAIRMLDQKRVDSPLGQNRYIPSFGIGNIAQSYNLEQEYKDLAQIKADKGILSTDYQLERFGNVTFTQQPFQVGVDEIGGTIPLAQSQLKRDTGFAVKVGNSTVYRMKDTSFYKGLPDTVDQKVAKTIESLITGQDPRNFQNDGGEKGSLQSRTADGGLIGGYTLDGGFITMEGQVLGIGSMKGFEAMAATNFQFGNLSKKEAEGFATKWLEGARGRNFKNQQEKLDHLNRHLNAARNAGGIVGQKLKTRTNISNYLNFNYKFRPSFAGRKVEATQTPEQLNKFEDFQKAEVARIEGIGTGQTQIKGPDQDTGGQDQDSFSPDNTGFDDSQGFSGYDVGDAFAEGGRVGMAEGSGEEEIMLDEKTPDPIMKGDNDLVITGNELLENEMTRESGFIEKPASQTSDQEGIADDIPIKLRNDQNPEGATIVMNKPSIDLMGEKNFITMVKDGLRYLRSKGKQLSDNDDEYIKKNFTDVAISSGEAVIQPELANVIGRKRLLALNERGKRRVAKAKRQSASEGGFIKKKFGDEVNKQGFLVEPVNPKVLSQFKKLNSMRIGKGKKAKPTFQRKDVEQVINKLNDQEALAMLIFAESVLSKDSMVELEAIGETVINRMNDRTYSFRNTNTIKDVLKQRSSRGTGSKMFMYDGLEPSKLFPRLEEMMNKNYWTKAMAAAENVLTAGGGEPDYQRHLRSDVFTYGRIGEAADKLADNLRNEYYADIGSHTFFSRVPEKGGRLSLETMGMSDSFYRGEKPKSFYINR